MRKLIPLVSLAAMAAILGAVLIAPAGAYEPKPKKEKPAKAAKSTGGSSKKTASTKPKKDTEKKSSSGADMFSVLQVGEEYQVASKDELDSLKKKIDEDYKKELDDYNEAAKAARKEKQKLDTPRPTKQKVVVKKKFKTKDEADAYLETLKGGGDEGDKPKSSAKEKDGDEKPAKSSAKDKEADS